jgi:hypothetical protein
MIQFRNHFFTDGRIPWTGDQLNARSLYLNTDAEQTHKHTKHHALSGIRTHDTSVRASEDSSCLRAGGYYDGLVYVYILVYIYGRYGDALFPVRYGLNFCI